MDILDVYKNSNVYDLIKKDISNNMVSHAYLLVSDDLDLLKEYSFCIAKQLLCNNDICNVCADCLKVEHGTHTDVVVYPKNDSKQILTNDILEIISSSVVSSSTKYKIFILNNFEKTLPQAQNKFLKTLEEPTENVVFLLLTTDEKSVLKTIVSRCKKVNVHNLTIDELTEIANNKKTSIALSSKNLAQTSGNLTTLNKIIEFPYYVTLKAETVNVFTKMKHSKNMLNYVYALSKYKDILEVLNELNTVVLDLLFIKNENLNISNSLYLSDLQNVAQDYSINALNKIALKIKESIKKIQANCNANFVLDGLLMYILEVKTKC